MSLAKINYTPLPLHLAQKYFLGMSKRGLFDRHIKLLQKSAFFTLGVLNTLGGWVVSAVEKKMENRLDVELSN